MAKTKTIELFYAYSEDCPNGEDFDYLTFKVHKDNLKDIILTSISVPFPVHEKEINITESQFDEIVYKYFSISKKELVPQLKKQLGFINESN